MVEISSWVFRPVSWVSPGGTSEVGRRRRLWTLIVCVAALNLVAMCPFLVLSPLIAQQKLRGAAAWSAIAFGCAADSMRGSALVMRMHPAHPSAPLSSAPWHSLLPLPTRGLPPGPAAHRGGSACRNTGRRVQCAAQRDATDPRPRAPGLQNRLGQHARLPRRSTPRARASWAPRPSHLTPHRPHRGSAGRRTGSNHRTRGTDRVPVAEPATGRC
jgi:hypothetical protein